VAAPLIGFLWAPGGALVADGAEDRALDQAFAFALGNLAWAAGQTAGSAGSAVLAQAAGDALPYLLLAGLCAVTVVVLRRTAIVPAAR
jgi:hypothetical protein